MNKVMVFGSFDLFHKGHEDYFRQAKSFGDYLIAVVSRNENLKRFKGQEPMYSEEERLNSVSENKYVNRARLGHKGDILQVIIDEKPDIICLGYDQKIDEEELETELKKRNLKPKIVRLEAYKPEIYKSSKLKKTNLSR
ncbi:FAD synthase [Candidatus Woesearchaeota archaeon]|nr:FAD synthase [Candidatus Woesearchaeota archaeon]